MRSRHAHPFAPPRPSSAGHGCLAALAVTGALAFIVLGAGGFVAGTYAMSHGGAPGPDAARGAPIAGPAVDLKAWRKRWGAIRAAYRLKDLVVPA